MGFSVRLAARVLLYAPSHRQDNTYHNLHYTRHGALAGTREKNVFNASLNKSFLCFLSVTISKKFECRFISNVFFLLDLGSGLGRKEDGITDAIKVKIKKNLHGVMRRDFYIELFLVPASAP